MNGKVYLLIILPSKQTFLTASSSSQKLSVETVFNKSDVCLSFPTKIVLRVYGRYW